MPTTIDKAGRVVIPKRIRDEMGLKPGQPLKFDVIDGKIIIEYEPLEAWVRIADDGWPIIETNMTDEQIAALGEIDIRAELEAMDDERAARWL